MDSCVGLGIPRHYTLIKNELCTGVNVSEKVFNSLAYTCKAITYERMGTLSQVHTAMNRQR